MRSRARPGARDWRSVLARASDASALGAYFLEHAFGHDQRVIAAARRGLATGHAYPPDAAAFRIRHAGDLRRQRQAGKQLAKVITLGILWLLLSGHAGPLCVSR